MSAADIFSVLGDYEDSRARSFALWDTISVRKTVDTNQKRIIALKNDGSVVAYTRAERKNDKGKFEAFYPNEIQTNREISNIVDISAGYYEFYALRSDGILYEFDHNGSQPVDETWTDIVAVDSLAELFQKTVHRITFSVYGELFILIKQKFLFTC